MSKFYRLVLVSLTITCLVSVFSGCGKDDDDKPNTPTNANIAGEYEGTVNIVYDDSDTSFNITLTAVSVSGNMYSLNSESDELAIVKVSGNNFTGEGNELTDVSGNLDGNELNFTGKTSDGGSASFSGVKPVGGGGGNDLGKITVDGITGSRESANCRLGSSDTYSYKLTDGEGFSIVFEYYDDRERPAGTYTILQGVGEDDQMAAIVTGGRYDANDNPYASYQASSGSFTIKYEGTGHKLTFNSITFDLDGASQEIPKEALDVPVVVSGYGNCTEDDQ